VLFDTFGDAGVFSRNLREMEIDRDKIRYVIISHDHWDHLAGLWPFLEKHKDVTVYICPGFGLETKKRLASLGVRVVEAGGPLEIKEDIYSTGQIRGVYAGQEIYEQAIVIKTARGVAIITGCAHPGITTIVDEVKNRFGESVFLIAGGFHLKEATQEAIENIARMLKCIGVKKVAPLHCTGAIAQGIFRKMFKIDCIRLRTGCILNLEHE